MEPNLIAFCLEIAVSLTISGLVLFLLQPVLREILVELCRGKTRAAFWSMFTRLMVFIAPLIVVVLYTKNTGYAEVPLVISIRATLLHALIGQFAGLAIIGWVILMFSRNIAEHLDADFATDPSDGEPA